MVRLSVDNFYIISTVFVAGLKVEEGVLSQFHIRQLQYFGAFAKHAVFFMKLLSVFIDPHDVRPVLNFGIIS